MFKKLKSDNGITLLSLVILIVVLVIISTVVISLIMGEDGVISKAKQAVIEHKRAMYYHEIELEITNEQIERQGMVKSEAFITSIKNRINQKDWIKEEETITCDENNEHQEDEMKNTMIVLTTKENYEIYVIVDNKEFASKIEGFVIEAKECTITYDKNAESNVVTGEVPTQTVKKGFYKKLSECNYSREDFVFVGWCENADGNSERIPAGNSIKVDEDITLYAIWKRDIVVVTFKANGGTGEDVTQNVDKNSPTDLSKNTFTRKDYNFVNWNTKQDGSGQAYTDEQAVTIKEPLTLFAQWEEKIYTLTYNKNEGNGTEKTQTGTTGTQLTVLDNSYTRTNYIFTGWGITKTSTASNEVYHPGDTITITDDMTLYALWRAEIKTTVSSSMTNLNTSAKVSAISGSKVTINTSTKLTSSKTGEFAVGDEVMLYVSNSNSTTTAGKFDIFKITSISSNVLTLNKSISTSIFTSSNCQIVKVLTGDIVTINSGVTVTASAYNGNCGGIIAIDAEKVTINGKLEASKCGYDAGNTAPNNGGAESSGNRSRAGGSNRYKGGNGGKNYQGYTGTAANAVGISTDLLTNKQMTFGGGSSNTKGGGIVFIKTKRLEIGSQYPISANGQGGDSTNLSGGGAGGSICVNAKEIVFTTSNKNYFVGANAGSGSSESKSGSNWPHTSGTDGTNVIGGTAPDSNSGKKGGTGNASNGGGGAQYGNAGQNATSTAGGNGGAGTNTTGWNAGGGGGGRRLCVTIYRYKYKLNNTNCCTKIFL